PGVPGCATQPDGRRRDRTPLEPEVPLFSSHSQSAAELVRPAHEPACRELKGSLSRKRMPAGVPLPLLQTVLARCIVVPKPATFWRRMSAQGLLSPAVQSLEIPDLGDSRPTPWRQVRALAHSYPIPARGRSFLPIARATLP